MPSLFTTSYHYKYNGCSFVFCCGEVGTSTKGFLAVLEKYWSFKWKLLVLLSSGTNLVPGLESMLSSSRASNPTCLDTVGIVLADICAMNRCLYGARSRNRCSRVFFVVELHSSCTCSCLVVHESSFVANGKIHHCNRAGIARGSHNHQETHV